MSLCMHCSLQWSSWVLRGKYTAPGLSGHDVWVAPTNTHQTRTSLLPPIMSSWTMWATSLVMWAKPTVAIFLLGGGGDTVHMIYLVTRAITLHATSCHCNTLQISNQSANSSVQFLAAGYGQTTHNCITRVAQCTCNGSLTSCKSAQQNQSITRSQLHMHNRELVLYIHYYKIPAMLYM